MTRRSLEAALFRRLLGLAPLQLPLDGAKRCCALLGTNVLQQPQRIRGEFERPTRVKIELT